jgi:hypothetical protein
MVKRPPVTMFSISEDKVMSDININKIINDSNIAELVSEAFSKHLNMSKEEARKKFDLMIEKEIGSLGKALASGEFNANAFNRSRRLPEIDFLADNDKTIKDE